MRDKVKFIGLWLCLFVLMFTCLLILFSVLPRVVGSLAASVKIEYDKKINLSSEIVK